MKRKLLILSITAIMGGLLTGCTIANKEDVAFVQKEVDGIVVYDDTTIQEQLMDIETTLTSLESQVYDDLEVQKKIADLQGSVSGLLSTIQGTNGIDGVDGIDGIDGINGTNGVDGTNASTDTDLTDQIESLETQLAALNEGLSLITPPMFENVPEDQTMYFSYDVNLLDIGLKAIDNLDGDISYKITVNITDTTTLSLGDYDVVYTVIDSNNNIRTKTIKLTVDPAPMLFDYEYINDNSEIRITSYPDTSNKDVVIPDSVGGVPITTIGTNAFGWKNLTSLVLGNNIVTIEQGAFRDNLELTSVVIPDNVEIIGQTAFYNCSISDITLGNSVTTINDLAFYVNPISSITIPASVVSINGRLFYGNTFTSVIILGDELRFNEHWEDYGFPLELMPK